VIRAELAWQWRRPRTLVTYGALAAFALVLTVSIAATGSSTVERVGDIPLFLVPGRSGLVVPVIALSSTMKFFLPLAVAIFAGECVAGEAAWGSLRYGLARPVSRSRYLGAKLAVAALLSLVAVILVPLASLLVGALAFGWHPLAAVDGGAALPGGAAAVFSPLATVARIAFGTAYVALGMCSIFAFAFFLSTLTSRPFVAVAGGVGLTIVSRVLNADYLPGVAAVNAYMPNNDVDLWMHTFQQPAQTDGMVHFAVLQLAYVVAFLGLAWWWFRRKDVLT
jgi:ABC-2 type transport system permease protein